MKTIEHLRDYLLENHVDEYGYLDIQGLDFSEFDGDVDISHMEVKGDLYQESQKVQGELYQESQKVQSNIHQGYHEVKGDLYQCNLKVEGNYHCKNVQVKGDIFVTKPTRLLKEVTAEELAELGYKLKGEN